MVSKDEKDMIKEYSFAFSAWKLAEMPFHATNDLPAFLWSHWVIYT
jgi:hypothetical protein